MALIGDQMTPPKNSVFKVLTEQTQQGETRPLCALSQFSIVITQTKIHIFIHIHTFDSHT